MAAPRRLLFSFQNSNLDQRLPSFRAGNDIHLPASLYGVKKLRRRRQWASGLLGGLFQQGSDLGDGVCEVGKMRFGNLFQTLGVGRRQFQLDAASEKCRRELALVVAGNEDERRSLGGGFFRAGRVLPLG